MQPATIATAALSSRPGARASDVTMVNPLHFPAWDSLIAKHPGASFFHRKSWARVLNETYGHDPVYFCALSENHIEQMLPVMEVSSPWTGRRGVSLPFSDFCEPFIAEGDPNGVYQAAMAYGRSRGWNYLECRDASGVWHPPGRKTDHATITFYGHVVGLEETEEELFRRLDGAIRRGMRKAEKEGISVEFNSTPDSVRAFYQLHCLTRKRHGAPPQPFRFFENIRRYVMGAGEGVVAVARLGERPIGAFVFLQHEREALYKFGASDSAFQHLRPNNLLMWEGIKYYARLGFSRLHLGRTPLASEGLRRFKLGFGAFEKEIVYRKYDFKRRTFMSHADPSTTRMSALFRKLPLPLLRITGAMLYPHLS